MPSMVKLGWWVLVLGGIALCIYAAIHDPGGMVFATVLLFVLTLYLYGFTISYFLGIRRHVVRHLGKRWKQGEVLTHVIRTSERIDLQSTLDRIRAGQKPAKKMFGYAAAYRMGIVGVISQNPRPVPLEWESYPSAANRSSTCATNRALSAGARWSPLLRDGGPAKRAGEGGSQTGRAGDPRRHAEGCAERARYCSRPVQAKQRLPRSDDLPGTIRRSPGAVRHQVPGSSTGPTRSDHPSQGGDGCR